MPEFEERLVKNGTSIQSIGHYPSGFMDVYYEDFHIYQYFEWFDGGGINEICICNPEANGFRFECIFDIKGCLETLLINGDVLEGIKSVSDRLRYPDFIDFNFLCNYLRNGSRLTFIGKGVNHYVFNQFLDRNSFAYIDELSFFRTSILPSDIEKLASFKNLKQLNVERSDGFKAVLSNLKKNPPDCVIKLNDNILVEKWETGIELLEFTGYFKDREFYLLTDEFLNYCAT